MAAGATLFMTLLAAFQRCSGRYSGQDDLVVGTPVANRTAREIEALIGFFVNTLALRIGPLERNPSFRELLGRVRRGRAWTPTPTRTCRSSSWSRRCSRSATSRHAPLFQVMFVLQNTPAESRGCPDLTPRSSERNSTAKFDLTLSVKEAERCGRPGIRHRSVRPVTDRRMAGISTSYCSSSSRSRNGLWRTLAILPSRAERRQLLLDWNGTAAARRRMPSTGCSRSKPRDPGGGGGRVRGEVLSYGELNARANQLAHQLIAWG